MKKPVLSLIALVVLISLVLVARNQVAWAANAGENSASSLQQSVVAGKDKPCDEEKDGNEKKKDRCKDDDEDDEGGTVKPPHGSIVITESGSYSIGGFCTFTVELSSPEVSVLVRLQRPLPRAFPSGVHKVTQGCLVTYYRSGHRIQEVTADLGSAQICFAALPKKEMQLYYHNTYASAPSWGPVDGATVVQGVVCGTANWSGTYVGTFKAP